VTAFGTNAAASPIAAFASRECPRALGEPSFPSHSDAWSFSAPSPLKEPALSSAPPPASALSHPHFAVLWRSSAVCSFAPALLPIHAESDPVRKHLIIIIIIIILIILIINGMQKEKLETFHTTEAFYRPKLHSRIEYINTFISRAL
jgi:hypothetical protein